MAQRVNNPPAVQETQDVQVRSLGREDPQRRKWQPASVFLPEKFCGHSRLAGFSPERSQRVGH